MKPKRVLFLALFLCLLPGMVQRGTAQEAKKRVLEEIVARVNNDIITRSEYERSRATLGQEAQQDCPTCTAAQVAATVAEREKHLLRDLIDNRLLVQKAKDLGYNVETQVVKRLDQLRQENSFKEMEELERAVNATGSSFDDFKDNIRNSFLTQELIRKAVGGSLNVSGDEIRKYYEEHKNEFVGPEQVHLREIFVSTEGKPESEIPELEKKAQTLLNRIRKGGEDFEALAKRFSDGSTAKQGGELGAFERGQLAKEIEEAAFKLDRGQLSEVIRTKSGFIILKVDEHYLAGLQPVDKVEAAIGNRIYMEKMQPALREYLVKLREESYVQVKPGYADTAAVASTPIVEVAAAPEEPKDKGKKKKGKRFPHPW